MRFLEWSGPSWRDRPVMTRQGETVQHIGSELGQISSVSGEAGSGTEEGETVGPVVVRVAVLAVLLLTASRCSLIVDGLGKKH